MKLFNLLFVLLFTFSIANSKAPKNVNCNIIYDVVQVQPNYKKGAIDLYQYVNKEVVPLIVNCYLYKSSNLRTSFVIHFVVEADGKISDVIMPDDIIEKKCMQDVRTKILSMEGWTAGQLNDDYVCSRFKLPINLDNLK